MHDGANFPGDAPNKPWVNNYSIDHDHERWGIKLKDFDYKKFHANLKEQLRKWAALAKAAKDKETT